MVTPETFFLPTNHIKTFSDGVFSHRNSWQRLLMHFALHSKYFAICLVLLLHSVTIVFYASFLLLSCAPSQSCSPRPSCFSLALHHSHALCILLASLLHSVTIVLSTSFSLLSCAPSQSCSLRSCRFSLVLRHNRVLCITNKDRLRIQFLEGQFWFTDFRYLIFFVLIDGFTFWWQ